MSPRAIEDRRHLHTAVDLVVGPRLRSLEGFTVNRVWPVPERRLIGPFIFLDHLQAVTLPAGSGFDVPPHPHIGLATVTWLFEGELMHADSLGSKQVIRPGELNWMTAGRGITHSERSPENERASASRLHGTQAWVALPPASEVAEPRFEHVTADALPQADIDGVSLRLIAGSAYGAVSPVATDSPLFYIEARLRTGDRFDYDPALGQRGIYIVSGVVEIDGYEYAEGRMLALADDRRCLIRAVSDAHLMLLGGEPLSGEREIWWNFVSSDARLIDRARQDWADNRFPPVEGDDERMSLPG